MTDAATTTTANLPRSGKTSEMPTGLWRFVSLIARRAGRKGWAAVFLQLGSTLSEGASILLLIPVIGMIDRTGDGAVVRLPDTGTIGAITQGVTIGLPAILILLVCLVTFAALLSRWRTIYTTDLVFKLVNGIRMDLVRAMGEAGWAAFGRMRNADLTHVLTGDAERLERATSTILAIVQTTILIAVYAAVCFVISPMMSLVALSVGMLFLIVLTPIRRRANALGRSITADRQEQYRIVTDFVQGMKVAKLYGAEGPMTERFGENLDTLRANTLRFRRFASIGMVVIQVTNAVGLAIFVYGALIWARLDLALIVVMLLIFMRIAPRFLVLQSLVQQVLQSLAVIDNVAEAQRLFDEERESDPGVKPLDAPRLTSDLVADGLSFHYPKSGDRPALDDVSFTLKAGRALAIVGTSGAGKSTLADICLGLVSPSRGRLLIDGIPLTAERRRAWRRQVAFVPQGIVLSHDTILANLRIAAPQATREDARAALEAAQAWSFVEGLPKGMDTVVGDGGGRLSGGEKQRIAIAQALMRRPRLLVLDEATSALDWENQMAAIASLSRLKGDMTLITIAHRPSMIALADDVIVLEEGRIVEAGPREVLSGQAGSRLARMMAAEDA